MLVDLPDLTPQSLAVIINNELMIHPESDIQDIYKLVYQAASGPTHVVPDLKLIISGIVSEAAEYRSEYLPLTQDIGASSGFIRLSLSAFPDICNDRVAQHALAEAILDSRLKQDVLSDDLFRLWLLATDILSVRFPIEQTKLDMIHEMIYNQQIPRHSQKYRDVYAPHYRLIHYSIYKSLFPL